MRLLACLLSSPRCIVLLRGGVGEYRPRRVSKREKEVSGLDVWLTLTLLKRHKCGEGGKKEGMCGVIKEIQDSEEKRVGVVAEVAEVAERWKEKSPVMKM